MTRLTRTDPPPPSGATAPGSDTGDRRPSSGARRRLGSTAANQRDPARRRAAAAGLTATLLLAACGTAAPSSTNATAATPAGAGGSGPTGAGQEPITVYSGRSETLVQPLLDRLKAVVGRDIQVRYGDSSELAAQLLEEGDRTRADLFFSQDAGALGALAAAGRLDRLPAEVTGRVLPGFTDPQGRWVATSARARVVAYHPRLAPEAAGFTSIDAILDPTYRGRIGFAPTNASFHSFVTALRVAKGEAGARDWLVRFKANQPKGYEKNAAVLDAVDTGQVSLGLINHYYWHAKVAEKGAAQVTSRLRFLNADDPGALVNVAGVGVLAGSTERAEAVRLAGALLATDSQRFFADQTAEYPVVAGVTTTRHRLPPLTDLRSMSIDLNRLDSLQATLDLLGDVGLT